MRQTVLASIFFFLLGSLMFYWVGRIEQEFRTDELKALYERTAQERDQAVRIMERHGPKFPIAQKPTLNVD